ncbi:MAG: AAA family ATPase [Chloroflexi bacterium]|nr:MAG: ATPase [Phototrophicales bacterium]RMF82399.1 MAG: AAA family ATPase [Chloroflexota bacterium]
MTIEHSSQPKERFYWESEQTLVDQYNRPSKRIKRFLRRRKFSLIFLAIVFVLLSNASLMRGFLSIAETLVTIILFMLIFVSQFVLLFWFLSRSRQYTIMPGTKGISFKDYRGQPEILEQAQQVVTLLRGVKAYENAGGEPLSGLLLEGPPGTGKTWLAQAISTEAGVPFLYMDASGLQAMFIGVGPMKVMRLYGKARKLAKEYGAAVIFLDEIDAIGSRGTVASVNEDITQERDGMFGGGMTGGMGVLSTMLIEMSGFSQVHGWRARLRSWFYKTFLRRKPPKPEKRVLTIGATNRVQSLDPAILRPGRFDKKIRVDVPDMAGRRDIFEYYLSKYAHDETMDPLILATETPGYSPADIKYLLNESLRHAFFDGRDVITYDDFMYAKPEHEVGIRAPLKHMAEESRYRLAVHEAGHAVAVRLFQPHHRITRITIIRQGRAFGYVQHYPAREAYRGLHTRDELLDYVRVSIAGKAAEIEFCGIENQTLGVAGDFRQIEGILSAMANAGMFGTMGATMGVQLDLMKGARIKWTREQAQALEEAYQQVLSEVRVALREHAHIMDALVEHLLKVEEMNADEVRAFFDQYGLHTPDPSYIRDGEEIKLFPKDGETPQLEAESGD